MSMCRVFSCVVGRGCLLWPVCSLGKTLLAFALLISYFKTILAYYSKYLLTSYFAFQSCDFSKDTKSVSGRRVWIGASCKYYIISIFYRKDIGAQNIQLCRQLAVITHIYKVLFYFSEAPCNLCYHYVDKYQQLTGINSQQYQQVLTDEESRSRCSLGNESRCFYLKDSHERKCSQDTQ